ncbi:MAG: signal recognition particle-docking protein FtsY [Schleiferiaceae bacterium]|nr:signal recognition particle-docking protein FtsY [Schleiferiaceae bacterium]
MALFGLGKTKNALLGKISRAIAGKSKVDESTLDNLEEALIGSDVGVDTAVNLVEAVERSVKENKYLSQAELQDLISNTLIDRLKSKSSGPAPLSDSKPHVILVVGVNGVGKTTTIGKLSNFYKNQDKKVILGAADTFRAAAVDQLKIWSSRVGVDIVEKGMNTDPAAVAYAAVEYGKSENSDLVIVDTAGRLHNKINLMNELSKIKRVMEKIIPNAPHEILLVLDASTGQNALNQAKQFSKVTKVTGLILTKMDGTAKGGIALAISDQLNLPVRFLGIGEGQNDLVPFSPEAFIKALLE